MLGTKNDIAGLNEVSTLLNLNAPKDERRSSLLITLWPLTLIPRNIGTKAAGADSVFAFMLSSRDDDFPIRWHH